MSVLAFRMSFISSVLLFPGTEALQSSGFPSRAGNAPDGAEKRESASIFEGVVKLEPG
jgi:hypothetical protein